MSDRNFPDLIEAWLDYYRGSAAPKSYQRWAMISVLAGALERRVWLMRDNDTGWYPNLYLFLIGPAGGGKSTVAEAAMSMLYEVKGLNFLLNDINESSLFHDLARIGKGKRFDWNGVSYPHSAATIFASEASTTFKEQYKGASIVTKLTDLYNGGPLGWSLSHGVGRSTRSDGQVTVLNPCINMLACSTPDWLITKCMTKNDAAGGFGSRILLIVSKDRLMDFNDWESDASVKDILIRKRIIEDLQRITLMKGPYITSDCFKTAWKICQQRYNDWMQERHAKGLMGGYQQRKMTQLYKVTMCVAAARRSDMVLTGYDIETAWAMLEEIEPSMIDVLDELEISPDAKCRRDIYDHLMRHNYKRVSLSELVRDFPRYQLMQIQQAVTGLEVMGKLYREPATSTRTMFQVIRT